MRSADQAGAPWRRILLLALVLAVMVWPAAVMAKNEPKISVSKFDHPPMDIRYFEDSDVIVFLDVEEASIYRSEDAGASWAQVKDVPAGKVLLLIMHKFDDKTAYALTEGTTHYKTTDRGASWSKFDADAAPSAFQPEILVFHADDPDRVIFNGMKCDGIFCNDQAAYTTDGFKNTKPLRSYTSGCWWAKSSKEFTTGDKEMDKSRTMCIVADPFSFFKEDQRLYISDSFFSSKKDKVDEFEPKMDTGDGAIGVVNLAVVKSYLLVATSSMNSDEMALFISDDSVKWHRAMFPTDDDHDHSHQINQNAYTVLESTEYSIQVDVMTSHPSHPMGVLFTSNSNGTYFTENIPYTNRNEKGLVDFEMITGIQGVYIVNVVDNAKAVEDGSEKKKVVSKITFDDGRSFESLSADDKQLHLHSETQMNNIGRIFSSPAPGLVMGLGSTGDSLGEFEEADLFVSADAGLTWKFALKGRHKYEFGDSGSVLVAVKDSPKEDVKEFSYSVDYGENWESVEFPDDLQIRPGLLTTTQDSTSLKFLLLGEKDRVFHMVAIDLEPLGLPTCKDGDMEDWHARLDDHGEPSCVMGHKQTYRRRKQDAKCFIKSDFDEPEPKIEDCECTEEDFECDYNFQRDSEDRTKCNKVGPIVKPDGACKNNPEDTFMGSSGWRLIPGNTCKRGKGPQKDDEVERKCSDVVSAPTKPGSGELEKTVTMFDKTDLDNFQKVYLESSTNSKSNDETIIMRPVQFEGGGRMKIDKSVWISKNHGKAWDPILTEEHVTGIYPHPHLNNVVFFTTNEEKVIYTVDRGHTFHSFKAPTEPGDKLPLSFHPNNKDWLIWVGKQCDKVGGDSSCRLDASLSTDRGDNWRTILRFVERCEFSGRSAYNFRSDKQVICLAHEEESNEAPVTVMTSDDFFVDDKTKFDGEVTDFALMAEFIVLARKDAEKNELNAFASLDGRLFEPAQFPHNFHEGHDNEFTVLDSSGHAVNLFVRTEEGADRQYGSIVKSNSNGTSYVLSAPNVNCDETMYVDFEKVPGLEGITLINTVANADKEEKKKEIQTKISHNDGAEWGFLAPPSKDVDGKAYGCSSQGDSSCALHLHHYTEREDKRKGFGAPTALGLLFGLGHVGSSLGEMKDADTFMSTDGGISWKNVKKGQWTWQYGDQGSIIVLVQRATRANDVKTKVVSYSLDEGKTWQEEDFTDKEVTVLDVTTLRSGSARNFLLWCRSGGDIFTVNLDFTGFADRACEATGGKDSDYYVWSPKHPLQDNDCLFGHVAKYLRKKPGSKCYNDHNLKRLQEYENCACTRQDYEWYAFFLPPSSHSLSHSLPV